MAAAILLTLLTWLAALAATARLDLPGRAERLLAAVLLWNGLVLLPITVLGELGLLRAGLLAVVAGGLAVAVIAAAGRDAWRALPRLFAEPLTLARDGVLLARENPLIGLAATFCMGLELWCVAAAYLAPAWRSFDGIWYHEPIIGFAIQAHGFVWADVPAAIGQHVNTLPRSCELTGLWFVIFAGRRLVDLANTLFHPPLVLAVYVLVRRLARSRAAAAGWAIVVGLVPAFVGQLQSSYIDVQSSALALAALVFVTGLLGDSTPRRRDLALAWLALALAVGAKLTNAIPAAILGLVLVVRAGRRGAAVTVAGGLLVAAVMATTMVPNIVHHGNPVYPIQVRVPALGIDLPGERGKGKRGFHARQLAFLYRVPGLEADWSPFRMPYYLPPHELPEYLPPYNYGYVVPWLVVPFGVLGVVLLVARRRAPPSLLLAVGIAGLTFFVMAVPLYARYQALLITALTMALARALDGRPRLSRWAAGVAAAISVATPFLQDHPQVVGPRAMLRMLAVPYPEREVTPAFGAPVLTDAGLRREAELGPGSIVVYADDLNQPAPLWNDDFSNIVLHLPSSPDFLARARAAGATWIYASEAEASLRAALAAKGSGWQRVGRLYVPVDGRADGAVWRRGE